MGKQDKGSKSTGLNVESKKGERMPLSCNKASERSPFLEYEYIPNQEKLIKVFDILFDEVIKRGKHNNLWNQSD